MKDTFAYLNCDFSILSSDNLSEHLRFLKQAVRDRTRLLSAGGYGVVDSSDPRAKLQNQLKPLWPEFAAENNTKVTVSPGKAVTPAGDIIEFSEAVTVDIAGVTRNTESLIIARYAEIDSEEIGYSSDGVAVSVGRVPVSLLTSVTKAEYLDPAVTTAELLDNSVVLAVVQWSDTEAPTIYTDRSNGYYWNRPWFSAADVEHRSSLGTGTVSDANPHGTGLNDLATGPVSLYDQLTSSGMVMSKSMSVPGVPGFMCFDEFSGATIQRDNNGTKTEGSWFSRFGVSFVELSAHPNTVFGAVDSLGDEVPLDLIPGTRICVLCVENAPDYLTVWYSKTTSLALAASNTNTLSFRGIGDTDVVVTEGKGKTKALVTTVPVRKYGRVPREVSFKFTASGQVYADPSVLASTRTVASNIGKTLNVNATLPVPGVAGIGLDGLPSMPSSLAAFVISGTDVDGNRVSELVYFDNSNFAQAIVPAIAEESRQVRYTQQMFAVVDTVEVVGSGDYRTTDVADASFIVLSKTEFANAGCCPVFSGFWDGEQLIRQRDTRRIMPVVRDGSYGYTSIHQSAEIIPGVEDIVDSGRRAVLIAAEDFSQPVFLRATDAAWDGLGYIDVPVIRPELASSDMVRRCYRSRLIPMRIDPSAPLRLFVTLFGADVGNDYGSVRVVARNESGRIAEGILKPIAGDNTGSLFAGFDSTSWSSVAFVISGKCRGFAAYFLRPRESEPNYFMEMV